MNAKKTQAAAPRATKYPKGKIIYHKHTPKFVDMLITRDLAGKRQHAINELGKITREVVDLKYNVNRLAQQLHPKMLKLVVSQVIEHDKDTKTYILTNLDSSKHSLPNFRAGQYIVITVRINGEEVTRPYSISSSPNDALNKGFYAITVKRKKMQTFTSAFILRSWKIGTEIVSSAPQGDFYYDSIRDPKNIVAVAGGSGITPFLSMAKAIVEGTEHFNLTILFGNRKKEHVFCYEELNRLAKNSKGQIKVVNVLSEEKARCFEHGLICLNLVSKHVEISKKAPTSFFLCGPKLMYKYVLRELQPLNLSPKHIRMEASNEIGSPSNYENYINKGHQQVYKLVVNQFGEKKEIKININDTILVALQKAKISIPSNCLSGQCSWCRIRLLNGVVFVPKHAVKQRATDIPNNIYYACSTFAVSDLEIEAY